MPLGSTPHGLAGSASSRRETYPPGLGFALAMATRHLKSDDAAAAEVRSVLSTAAEAGPAAVAAGPRMVPAPFGAGTGGDRMTADERASPECARSAVAAAAPGCTAEAR